MKTALAGWMVAMMLAALSPGAWGVEFFVAPDGRDTNAGTIEKPFATIARGQEAAGPGDTVYVRGGRYVMREADISRRMRAWAYVTYLDKSGMPGKPISYVAYKDERPVFDLSNVKPLLRINAFQVVASWVNIKGLEVTGMQVTLKGHTQSECFENQGSHNAYERLSMHDGQAIGIYSVRGSDNLFLNCDAYNNWDYTSENGKGGNVDGFGCHPTRGSTGNVFRGCRAWFNSDDGFDCINAREAVTFENCWAFYNGFNAKFERLGDGNGFKAGGFGATPVSMLPNPIPRNVVRFCVAVRNKASGFYANHQPGGGDWINNTAYRNGANFNMLCRLADNRTDVDGYGHKLWNNLGYKGGRDLARIDLAKCELKNNSFALEPPVGEKDFVSLNEAELTRPRQANGDLPEMRLLHLPEGSRLAGMGAFATNKE
jgi:hypothetical protein